MQKNPSSLQCKSPETPQQSTGELCFSSWNSLLKLLCSCLAACSQTQTVLYLPLMCLTLSEHANSWKSEWRDLWPENFRDCQMEKVPTGPSVVAQLHPETEGSQHLMLERSWSLLYFTWWCFLKAEAVYLSHKLLYHKSKLLKHYDITLIYLIP